ncbi:MAG: flippase [Chthoniobacterales bacterium]|jgi:O-antigen/teichoic acid export membrane protein|nr:flippase [Chthoniobacterales bacterium]
MKQSQTIVKNAVFGIASSVIGGAVYLATVLTIAHKVSVIEFGKYSFVLAFAMFFQLLADAGLSRMMIREIAREPESVGPLVGACASLIWLVSLAICLLVGIIVVFLPYGTDVKMAAFVMSFATLATFHAAGYSAVLRAFEDNELNYLGFILQKILLLVFILVVIHFKTGLVGFVVAHLVSNVLLWNFYHIVVAKFYTPIKLRVDVPLWKSLLLSALPMGGGVMLRQLALQLDILVLTWMTNLTTVGLFSGPYRISMALRTVPQTLALPLYPLYSRTAHLAPGRFAEVYQQSLKFFILISIPFAAFFLSWSKPVLQLALGAKFLPALPAMQLLGLGLVPFFMSTLFQYLFAALDEQKRFLISTCIGSALRILLLVLLIPPFHFVGPAIAFVCAETVIVGIWIYQLTKLGYSANLGTTIWRPIAAGAAMALVLYSVQVSSLPWQLGGAALSLVIYVLALLALRTFSNEEIHQAREGIAFVSPFVASWAKKLKRDT